MLILLFALLAEVGRAALFIDRVTAAFAQAFDALCNPEFN